MTAAIHHAPAVDPGASIKYTHRRVPSMTYDSLEKARSAEAGGFGGRGVVSAGIVEEIVPAGSCGWFSWPEKRTFQLFCWVPKALMG